MFARVMRRALEGVPRTWASTFVDDLFVETKKFLEQLASWQLSYDVLRNINVKLKPSKTHLNYTEVRKLGYLVSAKGRRVDPSRIKAILEIAPPKNIAQLESFLGMFPYNQEYLKGIYPLLRPLYDLKTKDSDGIWTDAHTKVFNDAKQLLCSIPLLLVPDSAKKYRIEVDACHEAVK